MTERGADMTIDSTMNEASYHALRAYELSTKLRFVSDESSLHRVFGPCSFSGKLKRSYVAVRIQSELRSDEFADGEGYDLADAAKNALRKIIEWHAEQAEMLRATVDELRAGAVQ